MTPQTQTMQANIPAPVVQPIQVVPVQVVEQNPPLIQKSEVKASSGPVLEYKYEPSKVITAQNQMV